MDRWGEAGGRPCCTCCPCCSTAVRNTWLDCECTPVPALPALQRPFKNEAPVLVEIFMHLFTKVEPQQLLDAPRLLEEATAARKREDAARAAAAKHQKQAGGRQGRRPVVAAAANTAHLLPRLPALPQMRPQPAVHKSLVARHVAQGAPSRHAHSGTPQRSVAAACQRAFCMLAGWLSRQDLQSVLPTQGGFLCCYHPLIALASALLCACCRRGVCAASLRPRWQPCGCEAQPPPLRAAPPARGGRRQEGRCTGGHLLHSVLCAAAGAWQAGGLAAIW